MMKYCTLLGTLLLFSFSTFGADWYVNDADTNGDVFTSAIGSASGTGSSTSPFLTFSAALAAASTGDAIYVDAGTYNSTIFQTINLANLSIIGAGVDRTLFDNESVSSNTNYFGLITANGVSVSNIRFSRYNNASNSLGQKILGVDGATGITLSNVQLDNSSPAGGGAALIIANGASVTIEGGSYTCNANGMNTTNFNGAIAVQGGSTLDISNALIHNNGSTQRGAGIHIDGGGALTVTNCTFTDNIGGYGGAICAQGLSGNTCMLSVSGCWFENNQANTGSSVHSGGAIAIGESVSASINNCMFINNSASGGSGSSDGGAISVEDAVNLIDANDSVVNITTCTFDNNAAANDGKAIYADESGDQINIFIDNCTFVNQSTNYAIAQRSAGEAAFTIQNSGSPTTEATALSPGPGFINMIAPSSTTSASKIAADGNCPSLGQDLSVLPVMFTDFKAHLQGRKVLLEWITVEEAGNKGFYIERSINADSWQEIGFVLGSGNSSATNTYKFQDHQPFFGTNYYRLRQMDFDGSFDYSSVVLVSTQENVNEYAHVYPNPAGDMLYVNLPFASANDLQLTIYHWNSSIALSKHVRPDETLVEKLDVSQLPAGIYTLQIIGKGRNVFMCKFLKQ